MPKNYVRITLSIGKNTPTKLKQLSKQKDRSMSKVVDLLILKEYERVFHKDKPQSREEQFRRALDEL